MINLPTLAHIAKQKVRDLIRAAQQVGRELLGKGCLLEFHGSSLLSIIKESRTKRERDNAGIGCLVQGLIYFPGIHAVVDRSRAMGTRVSA
jgi:hypothetical protein